MKPAYVLYVCENDINCRIALSMVRAIDPVKPVHCQFLEDLMNENVGLPEWLRGVPTLVETSTGEKFEGTQVLITLQALEATDDLDTNKPLKDDDGGDHNHDRHNHNNNYHHHNHDKNRENHESFNARDMAESTYDTGDTELDASSDILAGTMKGDNDPFAPLVSEADLKDDLDKDSGKINMEDVTKALASRGYE